jgi:hypothetical protein
LVPRPPSSKPRVAALGTPPPPWGDSLRRHLPSTEAVPNRRVGPFSRPAAWIHPEHTPFRPVSPAKSPIPAALSPRRGGKSPVFPPSSQPSGQTSPAAIAGWRCGGRLKGRFSRERGGWPRAISEVKVKRGENPVFHSPPALGCQPLHNSPAGFSHTAAGGIAEAQLPGRFFRRRGGFPLLIPPGRDGKSAFR